MATLRARLSECSAGMGWGVGWRGVDGTPSGCGIRDENEPMETEGFKGLYFIADPRGRIESCLSEA